MAADGGKNILAAAWSPWIAGPLAAALFLLVCYALGEPPTSNEVFRHLSEGAEKAVRAKGDVSRSDLPAWEWQAAFLAGIALGAFLAALAGRELTFSPFPEGRGEESFARDLFVLPASGLAGGALVMAGLALSGQSFLGLWSDCMALSVEALLFMAVVFVEAVLVGTFLAAARRNKPPA